MSVFSSTWNFIKRHKGKILLFSSAIGGYMLLNKYLTDIERSWEKSSTKDFISEARRKEIHFESTTETFNSTVLSLSPKMLRTLDKLLETDSLLDEIKQKPKQDRKLIIWENIKLKIFTRVLSEIYCISLFVSYLRMQLSVISGYMYVDTFKNGEVTSTSSSVSLSTINSNIQAKYLSLLVNFYQEGIEAVVNSVQEAVQTTIGEINLKENLTYNDLKTIFEKIKSIMAFSLTSSGSQLSKYLIKPDQFNEILNNKNAIDTKDNHVNQDNNGSNIKNLQKSNISNSEAKVIQRILTETQDILESDDFRRVLNSAIDVGYSVMLDTVLNCFVNTNDEKAVKNNSQKENITPTNSTNNFTNPHLNSIPMAKLLPCLKQALLDRKKNNENLIIVKHLICLDVLNCFAANVYEAFCEP